MNPVRQPLDPRAVTGAKVAPDYYCHANVKFRRPRTATAESGDARKISQPVRRCTGVLPAGRELPWPLHLVAAARPTDEQPRRATAGEPLRQLLPLSPPLSLPPPRHRRRLAVQPARQPL